MLLGTGMFLDTGESAVSKTHKNPGPLGADGPVQELDNKQTCVQYSIRDRCWDEKSRGSGGGWDMSVLGRTSVPEKVSFDQTPE